MSAIYRGLGRARRWLRNQRLDQNQQDNLVVLMGTLAAGGVWVIAFLWGLPA